MKKFISLFLVISLVTINCASLRTLGSKREKHGATLIITKKDRQLITGELVSVKIPQQSLLLLDSETGADISVDIKDIKLITIVRESKVWTGAGIAFIAVWGAAIGAAVGGTVPMWDNGTGICAVIGGLAFGIIGGISGAGEGKYKTIQIEGMTDSAIKIALAKLRKYARVRDYK
ncbi:MAG: hypothetical protein ISS41_09155 [Candidatus Aminicenantes bacterium]|nr:hypothetical protein [Candidatus Aminicenantes bacterium]MBL7083781.1 hypothetical protein [Candidatus Aminicenantes bacterium]